MLSSQVDCYPSATVRGIPYRNLQSILATTQPVHSCTHTGIESNAIISITAGENCTKKKERKEGSGLKITLLYLVNNRK